MGSVFVGLAWSALALPPMATGQPTEATFTRDIASILQRSCENCHRTGGVAPFPLTTHDEVRPWARAIKNKTLTRDMPPWFIEKNVGIQRFKNDISLSTPFHKFVHVCLMRQSSVTSGGRVWRATGPSRAA